MFKYNSFLSKTKKCLSRDFSSQFKTIVKIVSMYTDLSENESKKFLEKYKLCHRHEDFMTDSFETYKKMGFTAKEIVENGRLFKCLPREREQHFWLMEEGGFSNLNPEILIRARTLLNRRIDKLKEHGYIPMNLNVADSFLSYINNADFLKKVKINYSDDMVWSAVHFTLSLQFLAWRLQTTEKEIREIYIIHLGMPNKSFRVMEENISMAEELQFNYQRIIKCAYIIKNYPGYTKQTLREFPMLAGCDMRLAMRSYPTLVVTPTIRIRKTYQTLKEFNIPDEFIRKTMGILQVSPNTIRARLNEIKSCPDTEPLLKIPRLLTFLLYHTKVKSRLPFLQYMNLRCTNFQILGATEDELLKQFIREGKDVNNRNDVYDYFESILRTENRKDLIKKISKHPYYLNVPLKDIGQTFTYLVKCGFQITNIYHVLWILLYPMNKVKNALHKLENDRSVSFNKLTEIQKLNLILYSIEKEHHFTGHGIFETANSDFQEQHVN